MAKILHTHALQESWAIAKMTARCALYMVLWKFSRVLEYAHGYFSRNFKWAFVPIDPTCARAKSYEVRRFTRSWDNRGYSKNLGSLWICPRPLFVQFFNGLLFGCTLWMYRPNLKSVALPVADIRLKFWGVAKPQSWVRGRRGSGMVPFETALVISYK